MPEAAEAVRRAGGGHAGTASLSSSGLGTLRGTAGGRRIGGSTHTFTLSCNPVHGRSAATAHIAVRVVASVGRKLAASHLCTTAQDYRPILQASHFQDSQLVSRAGI